VFYEWGHNRETGVLRVGVLERHVFWRGFEEEMRP